MRLINTTMETIKNTILGFENIFIVSTDTIRIFQNRIRIFLGLNILVIS